MQDKWQQSVIMQPGEVFPAPLAPCQERWPSASSCITIALDADALHCALHPCIEIILQLLDADVNRGAELDTVERFQDGFVEALHDPVGLWALGLGAAVIDIL